MDQSLTFMNDLYIALHIIAVTYIANHQPTDQNTMIIFIQHHYINNYFPSINDRPLERLWTALHQCCSRLWLWWAMRGACGALSLTISPCPVANIIPIVQTAIAVTVPITCIVSTECNSELGLRRYRCVPDQKTF